MHSKNPTVRTLCALLTAIVMLCALGSNAIAQERNDGRSYSSVVVQERSFAPTHEFNVSVGTLPLDAFRKGVTVSGGYTLHFNHLIGWEILQGAYSFKVDTDLTEQLEQYDLRPLPFEVLDWYLSSNLVIKPLYWKGAWRNKRLVRGEFFMLAGGAFGRFTRSNRPGAEVGAGVRLFATKLWSMRFDTRYMWFFGDNLGENLDVKDELSLNLGASLSF